MKLGEEEGREKTMQRGSEEDRETERKWSERRLKEGGGHKGEKNGLESD